MNLIVGLGNPGKKYLNNRHNIGFQIVDACVKAWKLVEKKEYHYLYAVGENCIFIKPTTYMNLSGKAVQAALDKFPISDILVIVDDVNLPLGSIRFRTKGGDGGHNGIKSITDSLETDKYNRMRIGVGSSDEQILSDYVLEDFKENDIKLLKTTMEFSTDLLLIYRKEGYQKLLNYYSIHKVPYSESINDIQNHRP